jgi:site-specific recombinase XerD
LTAFPEPQRLIGPPPGRPSPNFWRNFPPELLTPDEVAAIIGGCSSRSRTGIRNRALLTLFYRSGIRISEALGSPPRLERTYRGRDGTQKTQPPRPAMPPLRVSDVNIAAHSIRVLHGKGDKATTRGFHPTATDALARWIDTRKSMGFRNGAMFCTLRGDPLQAQYVRLLLGRLAERAGIDKRVHPHGFRHTFAVELRQAGVDVGVISRLLGHSSIAVTTRYLDHLTNDQAIGALAAVDLPPLGGV